MCCRTLLHAPYTHAPISPAQAEPAFLLFLLLLAFRGCGPTGESLPSKGATTARRRRDFRLCVRACFAVKRGRTFCIALCSLNAPETRNLSWRGRLPNEAACIALGSPRSMRSWRMEAQHTHLRPFTCACGATPSGHFGRTGNTTRTQEGARESFDFTQHARRTAGS